MQKAIVKTEEYVTHLEEYFIDSLERLEMQINIQSIEDSKKSEFIPVINDNTGFFQHLQNLSEEYRILVLEDNTENTYPALATFKHDFPDVPTHRERFIYED